jgi:hypothetical protein
MARAGRSRSSTIVPKTSSSSSFSCSISETRRIKPAVGFHRSRFFHPPALSAAVVRKRERRRGRRRERFSERGRETRASAHRHTGVATASESVSARFSRSKEGRFADALRWLERVALAPQQSFLISSSSSFSFSCSISETRRINPAVGFHRSRFFHPPALSAAVVRKRERRRGRRRERFSERC